MSVLFILTSFVLINVVLFGIFGIQYVLKLDILNRKIFKICTILGCFFSPILFAVVLLCSSKILFTKIEYLEFSDYNKLIALSLCIVHFSMCVFYLVFFTKQFLYEFLLGNFLFALSYVSVLTNNLLLLFYLLEIITFIVTMLIFSSSKSQGLLYAKNYFINHLIASTFMLVSIIIYNHQMNDFDISNFQKCHDKTVLCNVCYYLFLVGIVINLGCFPFAGYIVYSYSIVSYFAYTYLFVLSNILVYISFKLFAGVEILFLISLITLLYLGFKLLFMKNIIQILTSLSVIQNSIFLGMISFIDNVDNMSLNNNLVLYIFTSFCYKSLLHLSVMYYIITFANTNLKNFPSGRSYIVVISIIFAVLNIFNVPFMSSFYIKSNILALVDCRLLNIFVSFSTVIMTIVFPWQVIFSKNILKKQPRDEQVFPFIALFLISVIFLPFLSDKFSCFLDINYSTSAIKQLLLMLGAACVLIFVKITNNKEYPIFSFVDNVIFYIKKFSTQIYVKNYLSVFKNFFKNIFSLNKKIIFYLENHSVKTSLLIFIFFLESCLFIFIK